MAKSRWNENIDQQMNERIIELNNSSSFKILRKFHPVIFSPISFIYVHTMARAIEKNERLKTQLMDIKMFQHIDAAENEKLLHDEMTLLHIQLNTEQLLTNISVNSHIFKRLPGYESYSNNWQQAIHSNIVVPPRCEVNQWIAENSCGTLPKYHFDMLADILLANCVYFCGQWDLGFIPPVYNGILPNYVSAALECKFVELKFKGDRFSMIFMYPFNLNAYQQLFVTLYSDIFLLIIRERLTPSNIEFKLPKGMTKINIRFDHLMSLQSLDYISDTCSVNQMVYINITETGTEAAAATICNPSFPELDNYKIPNYVFAIYDTSQNVILFVGQACNNDGF